MFSSRTLVRASSHELGVLYSGKLQAINACGELVSPGAIQAEIVEAGIP
jgi:hypothetical protein